MNQVKGFWSLVRSPFLVTASRDKTARVWDAETGKARIWDVLLDCCRSQSEADRLASLAEALSGLVVSENGSLDPVSYDRRAKLAELARSANPKAPRLSVDWLVLDFARRFGLTKP